MNYCVCVVVGNLTRNGLLGSIAAQVKGQIARIARCLQDSEPCIAGLAHLFFDELSHKVTKVL